MWTPFTRTIARNLRRPSGWFGRYVMAPALNRANAALNRAALEQLDLQPDDRVLEVGFGGGDMIARMARVVTRGAIAGLDYSPDVVALGERRFRAQVASGKMAFVCADVAAMPYPEARFTKACTMNTIYFWPDPAAALRELNRVIVKDGVLVLGFRLGTSLGRHSFARYQNHYEVEDVRAMLEAAGFRALRFVPGRNRIGAFASATARSTKSCLVSRPTTPADP
jgi:SAM-dependent methyltransferase